MTTSTADIRQDCNRRRAANLTIRGATERYSQRLKGLGCLYDPREYVWLAPSADVLATVGQWPGLRVGTEGPRLEGDSWPAWCRGWAVMDLPQSYAARWLPSLVPDDDPELYRWMRFRADGGKAKGKEAAPPPQPTQEQIEAREAARRERDEAIAAKHAQVQAEQEQRQARRAIWESACPVWRNEIAAEVGGPLEARWAAEAMRRCEAMGGWPVASVTVGGHESLQDVVDSQPVTKSTVTKKVYQEVYHGTQTTGSQGDDIGGETATVSRETAPSTSTGPDVSRRLVGLESITSHRGGCGGRADGKNTTNVNGGQVVTYSTASSNVPALVTRAGSIKMVIQPIQPRCNTLSPGFGRARAGRSAASPASPPLRSG